MPDECTWEFEDDGQGHRRLSVVLQKVDDYDGYNFWPCVIEGHPMVDPEEHPMTLTKDPLSDDY